MDHGKTNEIAASHSAHGMNERVHFCDGVFLPPLVVFFSLARVFSPSPPIRQRPLRAYVEGHIRVHIYLSVCIYIYRGNKETGEGGKPIRRSLLSRNERTTRSQFGTGRGGAPLSLMNLRPHRPGVRNSAPFISAAGASHNSHYPNGLQNEASFAFAVGEDPHHISSPWAGVTTELGGRSAFVACPPFNRISQPVTPAAPLQRAGVIATDTTALLRMRTGATTPSAAKRSGASQGTGDCVMALIHNRANEVGVALCLFSSLAVIITQYGDSVAFAKTLSFVFSRNPVEVLVPETALDGNFVQTLLRHFRHITFTGVQRGTFDEARGAHRLFELMSTDEACLEVGNTDRYLCVAAANALVEFLEMNYNCTLLPHTVRV
ncbi:mismatch repair protein, partial [Trypanosoma cruzi]